MSDKPYFHMAFLVRDLDAAIQKYSEAFGIEFLEPVIATARFKEEDRDERELNLRLTYSKQDTGPYIELMEAQGDGLYGIHRGEGPHHIGIWEPDCEAKVREDEALGHKLLAAQYTPEGKIIVAYFASDNLHGTMIEIVDEGRKPMMSQWFSGGGFID